MAEDILAGSAPSLPTAVITQFEERHSASLLEQFYLTLSVTYLASLASSAPRSTTKSIGCSRTRIRGGTRTRSRSCSVS